MPKNEKIEYIAIDQLLFDPENPRLPEGYASKGEEDVYEYMLTEGDIVTLMKSIASSDFSGAEPLLVVKTKDETIPSTYNVVEGNRRLAAAKLLNHPEIAKKRQKAVLAVVTEAAFDPPAKLPCLIYNERPEILVYLGYRHITGVRKWTPLAKAKYLRQLKELYEVTYKNEQDLFKALADTIATKEYYAKQILTALSVYEYAEKVDHWDVQGLSNTEIKFSVLSTALGYKSIANFVGLEDGRTWDQERIIDSHLKELFEWCFLLTPSGVPKVPESRRLSSLANVVSKSEALQAFRAGSSLDDAALYTSEARINFFKFIQKSNEWATAAQKQLFKISSLPEGFESDRVDELLNLVKSIDLLLNDKLKESRNGSSE